MRKQAWGMVLLAMVLPLAGAQGREPVQGPERVPGDALRRGFEDPPNGARPRVWWHWMNGNITREGIRLDLEWMHRTGLGGFQNFDAAMNTPQVVSHRLVYMTPEWKQTFLYATRLADRLGLEESIASSPGWSETGGPWVPPAEGMKKYAWSETRVAGDREFRGKLEQPPATTGPFQDVPLVPEPLMPGTKAPAIPMSFYRDSAVVAYRLPDGDVPLEEMHPLVTSSSGAIDAGLLKDRRYRECVELPSAPVGEKAWIGYSFAKPVTIQSLTLVLGAQMNPPAGSAHHGESEAALEVSGDGEHFRRVARIDNGEVGTTLSFAPVTSRFFRVTFLAMPPRPPVPQEEDADGWMGIHVVPSAAPHVERIAELVLFPGPRVSHYQEKAAFVTIEDTYHLATPAVAAREAIDPKDVVDLTGRMGADGELDWTPPEGRWVIVRMGYSLLGITNHPATAEATGLEVDKLNHVYVKHYMDHYLDSYRDAVGSAWMGKRGVRYVVTDSWEAGAQNWTDDMLAQFKARRGYDAHPWLPVLTGHVVGSAAESDGFLWDFRKTLADLVADEHYAQVQASLNERGLGHYGESHEGGRALIADGMEVKKLDEVPMSAMWTQSPGVNRELYGYNADDRESASVGHLYGQNLAAAESMTAVHAPWAWSPATLKPTADKEMAEGINRFVIHCSVHQPLVGKAPGLGLGPYGQWFNRNETWAEEAKPWVDYLARSSYLLQQGHFAADVLYFYGEDSNLTALFGNRAPDVPEGYGFDYVNADALQHVVEVKDGELATASGMRYKVLALDGYSSHMSLPVLRRIEKLVEAGAVVVGNRPAVTPSLADDAAAFTRIAERLWPAGASGHHAVGKGRVFAGMTIKQALDAMQVKEDFSYTRPAADTQLLFVHRKLVDGDLYYVDHRNDRAEDVEATFRVQGRAAELWHADTGRTERAGYAMANGRTTVPLHLEPWETVFVVFRKPVSVPVVKMAPVEEQELQQVSGPWKLSFPPGRGAPASVTMGALTSWSESADAGVKYFSGTATYTKTVMAEQTWFRGGTKVYLDLGEVKNLAEVTVNGRKLGVLWHAPYRVEVAGALRPGRNIVTVKVTNAWVNRIIGDLQPGVEKKYSFLVIKPYTAESALLPSGLLGPVRVVARSR